jgi:transcription antitermination factor NusG
MGTHLDFWQKANWFAIQSKSRQEHLAARRVAELNLEVFLPQFREEQSAHDGIRSVSKALFSGYFFTQFCPLESFEAVRFTHGVLRVVGSNRFPIPVAPEIISGIRKQIQTDGFIRLERRGFQPGDKVTIERGPFQGWMGEVQREQDEGKRVMILLEEIQQARLSVEKGWLSATASVR